jgi:hypothetical protein
MNRTTPRHVVGVHDIVFAELRGLSILLQLFRAAIDLVSRELGRGLVTELLEEVLVRFCDEVGEEMGSPRQAILQTLLKAVCRTEQIEGVLFFHRELFRTNYSPYEGFGGNVVSIYET